MLNAINDTGKTFLVHTKLNDKFVLRLAVGNPLTQEGHVTAAWELLQEHTEAAIVASSEDEAK